MYRLQTLTFGVTGNSTKSHFNKGFLTLERYLTADVASNPSSGKPFSEIPQPRFSLPYIGTAWHYRLHPSFYSICNMQKTLSNLYEKYGPLLKECIHGNEVLHVFSLNDIKTVYQAENKIPYVEPLLDISRSYRLERGFAAGVGNMNGEEWYRQRSVVNRLMMRPLSVSRFFDQENEVINEWMEDLKSRRDDKTGLIENLELQVSKWNYETSVYNVFCRRHHCFNEDDSTSEAVRMIRINNHMFEDSICFKYSLLPWQRWWSTPTWRKFLKEEDFFYGTVVKYMREAVDVLAEMTKSGVEADRDFAFLRYLMQNEKLSYEEAHITAQSLYVDGFSTTVPTANCLLYCLATEPKQQELLNEEICRVIGSQAADSITMDIINQMPLVKAFLKEVFRLFPIQPHVSRVTKTDLVLSGFHVPAETSVLLNNGVHLRDPKQFTEPEIFRPQRWLRDDSHRINDAIHPFTLLPFSHGTRMCLGRRFAEQELYLFIVKMVQNFRLEWIGQNCLGQKYQMLNIPDRQLQIVFTPRAN